VTVTPLAALNGSISPATAQSITYSATATFTVTPNTGYVASVGGTCGGTLSGKTYTTNAIAADCTVIATFTRGYTVTLSAGANGTISPNTPQLIAAGATATFTLTPNAAGYMTTVNGTCGGTISGTTYTTNPVTANCTESANFTRIYTVTPSAGTHGTISPAMPTTVPSGGYTAQFFIEPNAGYTAIVGGTCGGTLTGISYMTNPVTGDCTVNVDFTDEIFGDGFE